jgi:hypothetical protein
VTQETPKKDWRETFLSRLRKSPNISAAAKAAGYSRGHVYRVRNDDDEFAQAWDDAIAASLDVAEGELYRRAVRGVVKHIYYQDKQIDTVREYSDTLLIFLLKSHKPEVYRETVRNEHTGKDGKDLIPVAAVQPGYMDKL